MHRSVKTWHDVVRICIARRTLYAMTGIITLSSSCPCSAATATHASLPITWKQTWFTIYGMEGFIFHCIMDDQGCTAGIRISLRNVLRTIDLTLSDLGLF